MQLTRDNVLWFAGLFEGEGCLSLRTKQDRNTKSWALMVNMTDHDVVKRVHSIFGGNLYFKEKGKPHHKDQSQWQMGNLKHIYAIVSAVIPFMGERRRAKMEEFIKDFSARAPNKSEQSKRLWNDPEWRANQLADRKARIGKPKGLKKSEYMNT